MVVPSSITEKRRMTRWWNLSCCGLALDYCAFFTAVDGADKGYQVLCPIDLTAPVGQPADSVSHALETMAQESISCLKSDVISDEPASHEPRLHSRLARRPGP